MEIVIDIIQCLVAAIIGYWIGHQKKQYPHKFACMGEGCGFKVSGTNEKFVKAMVEAHLEKSHPQGY